MDQQQPQQWTAYSEPQSAARQARYAPHAMASPQQPQRESAMQQPQIKQDPYASPTQLSRTNSIANAMSVASPAASQTRGLDYNDGDGDIKMEDADPYKPKYAQGRVNHQHRSSQQFLQHEESSAARRYSPMNLSPTSPYTAGTAQQPAPNYASFTPQQQPHSNRQSPTRNNPYISPPNSYYSPPGTCPFAWSAPSLAKR